MNLINIIKQRQDDYKLDEVLLSNLETQIDDSIKEIKSRLKSDLCLYDDNNISNSLNNKHGFKLMANNKPLGPDIAGIILTYIRIEKTYIHYHSTHKYSVGCQVFDKKEGTWFTVSLFSRGLYIYCYKYRDEIYRNDLLNGTSTTYNIYNTIEKQGRYIDNVKDGEWIDRDTVDNDGETQTSGYIFKSVGVYNNGVKDGIWTLYSYCNEIKFRKEYKGDKITVSVVNNKCLSY